MFSLYFRKARFSPLLYRQSQELPNGSVKEAPAPISAPLEAPGSATTEDAGDHKPKLCRLTKEDDSYGFHLNAIRGQPGSFVKEVRSPVPANTASWDGTSSASHSCHDTNSGHTSLVCCCGCARCLCPVGKGGEAALQLPGGKGA